MEAFPVRYVIVDNSGSMNRMDGQRLVRTSGGAIRPIKATRWGELGDVVLEMTDAVNALEAETHFHLLNPTPAGQYFVCADQGSDTQHGFGRAGVPSGIAQIKRVMDTSPTGSTPLTEAVLLVIQLIAPAADQLRASGQQAVVVLATDGLPNDPHTFLHALQDLQRLPVWLVVRLCTDEEAVVNYWSEVDAQLEAPLETLDDIVGEAAEVHKVNPWLTYAPSLHLARTLGMRDKLFDLLDERPLLPSQCKQLLERVLGCEELPEPELEAEGFQRKLKAELGCLPPVYNPMSGTMTPWVDLTRLRRDLLRSKRGSAGCVVS